jgi:hydroxymethylpyrimidine pyrophosphatase-like HAD family hydrolase
MIYIVDIDGTLADPRHRLHFIEQKPRDWDAFFAACQEDSPITDVIATVRALERVAQIFLATGRSEVCRLQTVNWLNRHVGIAYSWLLMRREGDHREDNIVKSEMLDRILDVRQLKDIAGVFEDRKQVVDMYRKRGLTVFQVADGDY